MSKQQNFGRGAKFHVGSKISCWEQNFMLGAKFRVGTKFWVVSKFWVWERNFMLAVKFRVRGENILEMGQFNAKKI